LEALAQVGDALGRFTIRSGVLARARARGIRETAEGS
jgi:hypothetical protein